MTEQEAYRILGASMEDTETTLKKKYRQLMHLAHPDAQSFHKKEKGWDYSAQEINEAYRWLLQREAGRKQTASKKDTQKESEDIWKAPINPNAFCARKVFHYAEDSQGGKIGEFCIAQGNYYWTTEEDFSLFLKSIYQCGKELLDEIDGECRRSLSPKQRLPLQAELTYLLAVQFIDGMATLKQLVKEEGQDLSCPVYYVGAMLEKNRSSIPDKRQEPKLMPGDSLFPQLFQQHRLYLKNEAGQQVGYLSFRDDRLYYIIIPLFEQKRVQIKLRVAEKQGVKTGNKRGATSLEKYQNLDLWLRFSKQRETTYPESISLQIEQILEKYRNSR